jgi:AraC-like DNA-binding protein
MAAALPPPVATTAGSLAPASLLVYAARERSRGMLRSAFPRRRTRLILTRSMAEFAASLRETLIDAALVDLGAAQDEAWAIAELARDFPTVPFYGVLPLRSADAGTAARCAGLGFADVLFDGIDDAAARELIVGHTFTARFAAALHEPPAQFGLCTPLQRAAWGSIVMQGGRPVRTSQLAESLSVTREHLSRSFSADGAPNLKRVIDLVRLVAAAELAKNPGYDVRDVAQVLGFASSSHLSSTAQRVVGTRPASLARLRAVDLFERFANGHGRSRATPERPQQAVSAHAAGGGITSEG